MKEKPETSGRPDFREIVYAAEASGYVVSSDDVRSWIARGLLSEPPKLVELFTVCQARRRWASGVELDQSSAYDLEILICQLLGPMSDSAREQLVDGLLSRIRGLQANYGDIF